MENWGLITYGESSLLFSEDRNSLSNKQNVALIIAHELAHFVCFKNNFKLFKKFDIR